jgi:hypothetical protein
MGVHGAAREALRLAEEYGVPVFPCRPDKRPYTEHGFKDATTNLDAIENAWHRCPDALVAVPTGCASRIDVLDVDPAGLDWYREHVTRLAAGRTHRTRRNGFHLLYQLPEVEIRNSASKIAPGVDVRGEGGYIIWWPAHGLEAIGSLEDMTPPPQWLLDRVTVHTVVGRDDPHDGTYCIPAGGRNDYLSREAFRLRKQGMSPEQILAVLRTLNSARCVPPLDNIELETISTGKKRILPDSVTVEDFYAYMPTHQYIFVPSRELWPASSVNKRVGVQSGKASDWLDQQRPVDQMTWAPGLPMLIEDKLVSGGGWIERQGCNTFNLYQPPAQIRGDVTKAVRWLEHVQRVFPNDAVHLIRWLAHRVQRPGEKINHALVLGGSQGIGKDTILEPVKNAVGPWNFAEVSPSHLLGRFNGFIKSVVLRISEARDLGEVDRYGFYDHLKTYTAAPPDVVRCDEKNIREHAVMNVTGVIITSNHKTDGIYLPADDRRHYVAWSELTRDDFSESYWRGLYSWFAAGGTGHVAAYLASLDLSDFDPKAPPPKTAAFWDIVDASRAPEDAELADVLDNLGNPPAVTVGMLCGSARDSFAEWLQDRRNSRQIPYRMEAAGYVAVRNDADRRDGQWKVAGRRQTIYAKRELSQRDRIGAAMTLCRDGRR